MTTKSETGIEIQRETSRLRVAASTHRKFTPYAIVYTLFFNTAHEKVMLLELCASVKKDEEFSAKFTFD